MATSCCLPREPDVQPYAAAGTFHILVSAGRVTAALLRRAQTSASNSPATCRCSGLKSAQPTSPSTALGVTWMRSVVAAGTAPTRGWWVAGRGRAGSRRDVDISKSMTAGSGPRRTVLAAWTRLWPQLPRGQSCGHCCRRVTHVELSYAQSLTGTDFISLGQYSHVYCGNKFNKPPSHSCSSWTVCRFFNC
jgi:hypothetical protein